MYSHLSVLSESHIFPFVAQITYTFLLLTLNRTEMKEMGRLYVKKLTSLVSEFFKDSGIPFDLVNLVLDVIACMYLCHFFGSHEGHSICGVLWFYIWCQEFPLLLMQL